MFIAHQKKICKGAVDEIAEVTSKTSILLLLGCSEVPDWSSLCLLLDVLLMKSDCDVRLMVMCVCACLQGESLEMIEDGPCGYEQASMTQPIPEVSRPKQLRTSFPDESGLSALSATTGTYVGCFFFYTCELEV